MRRTVKEIIEKWLKDNGYNGLFDNYDCGCAIGDLMPCDNNCGNCLPGYKHPGDEEADFYILDHPYCPPDSPQTVPNKKIGNGSD